MFQGRWAGLLVDVKEAVVKRSSKSSSSVGRESEGVEDNDKAVALGVLELEHRLFVNGESRHASELNQADLKQVGTRVERVAEDDLGLRDSRISQAGRVQLRRWWRGSPQYEGKRATGPEYAPLFQP